jgi:cutinase
VRKLAALLVSLVALAGASLVTAPAALAASCEGTYTIIVGGTGDHDSNEGFWQGNISQRVGYPAIPTGPFAREGVNELNRLIRNQRNVCPHQHVKAVGFSLGAAVVHIWVTENWQSIDDVNAVLLADPKRAAGPGSAGFASHPLGGAVGFPLVGVDDFFGDIPVLTICTDDMICDINAGSGPLGYATGKHMNYNHNVDGYSNDASGTWYNGVFYP